MGHAHAVFDMEQGRQQRLEIKMRHAVEVRLLGDILAPEDCGECLKGRILAEQRPINFVPQRRRSVDQAEIAFIQIVKEPFSPKLLQHGLVVSQGFEVGNN